MNKLGETHERVDADDKLLDLVSAALVDPDLHTDLRMRLCHDITRLLAAAQGRGPISSDRAHEETPEAQHEGVSRLLRAALVDPNLHTDRRMRLYREIPEMVRAAYAHAPARHPDPSG